MKQKSLYLKDINRAIEGVIKANEDRHILQELDEYVLTNELTGKSNRSRMLPGLFEELVKEDYDSNVWISGYFGSGKSHLLKMLSFVIENKIIDGLRCAEVFAKKASDDFELEANIRKAAGIPTESILFNIAAKSDGIISSVNEDADPVLNIFLKVFNEHLGFDPLYPEVAEIERLLYSEGKYENFKVMYQERFGNSWENGRESVFLNQHKLTEIFADIKSISKEEANQQINNLFNNYRLSIEGFGDLVKNYIDTKESGFRLVFCVDEVGQFIAEDVRLMLSLQTIAEVLSTKTQGRSFLIVTSQNDLDATIGDIKAKQAHDFSRIQGRFGIKIPLTSANADEVIQKRLLQKTDESSDLLGTIYDEQENHLKTLFRFCDKCRKYQTYKGKNHFVDTYPFIPYQFDLFQASIKSLSEHNAFIGSQQSVGERSMLGVFQQVAKYFADHQLEDIVTFDKMYEGIKDVLQSNIQSDIIQAEKSIDSDLALQVLKALFLVKYVKGFHSSAENIAILLLPRFDIDLGNFQKEIREALNLLESQTYIQRNANDTYEFLTNLEKDIENEIKNTEIEASNVVDLLSTTIFIDILKESKIKLDLNNQPYEYGRKLDDIIQGNNKDIYVNIVTPINADQSDFANPEMSSIGRPTDLIVMLPQEKRIYEELRLYEKTKKFLQIAGQSSDQNRSSIIVEKGQQHNERRKKIIEQLKETIGMSRLFVNGSELKDIESKEPRTRISLGVQHLIKTIYTNLRMLNVNFEERDLERIINIQDDVLFADELHESEIEVLNRIGRMAGEHERTTIRNLIDHFKGRPYGWYQTAVLCLIAKLYKRNKIALKQDGNNLEKKQVLEALRKTNQFVNTLIDLEEEIDATILQNLKQFHQEYFNEPNTGNEPKEVSSFFKARLMMEVEELSEIYASRKRLIFLESIAVPLERIKQLSVRDHPYFFMHLKEFKEGLLVDRVQILDPLLTFMRGNQLNIFESIITYRETNRANFDYIESEDLAKLEQVAVSSSPFSGNLIKEGKEALDRIKQMERDRITSEYKNACEAIEKCVIKIKSFTEFKGLSKNEQEQIITPFQKVIDELKNEQFIGNIRTKMNNAVNDLYQKQVRLMMEFFTPTTQIGEKQQALAEIVLVRKECVNIDFHKPYLETKTDVKEYLSALEKEYLKVIAEDKKISL